MRIYSNVYNYAIYLIQQDVPEIFQVVLDELNDNSPKNYNLHKNDNLHKKQFRNVFFQRAIFEMHFLREQFT